MNTGSSWAFGNLLKDLTEPDFASTRYTALAEDPDRSGGKNLAWVSISISDNRERPWRDGVPYSGHQKLFLL
jgi:hypothetical protein